MRALFLVGIVAIAASGAFLGWQRPWESAGAVPVARVRLIGRPATPPPTSRISFEQQYGLPVDTTVPEGGVTPQFAVRPGSNG